MATKSLNSLLLPWAQLLCFFLGERGQARGEHEVRDTRDFFSRPSCRAYLALRARLALALARLKNAKKITPVLQATFFHKLSQQASGISGFCSHVTTIYHCGPHHCF